jgi:hypothetical protein
MPGVRAMTTINIGSGLTRIVQIIAGVDDLAYILNPDGSAYQCPTGDNFSGSTLQVACGRGFAYFVDGTSSIMWIDVGAGGSADVQLLVADEGDLPVGADPDDGPSLICFYRDRMVLAGVRGDEQNFFMSRSGVHDDFDYSQKDPAAAVVGNASLAGQVGAPIRALIPWRDDVLIFGCDRSLWKMVGDIAAGGSIQMITDAVGVWGPNAWTTDANGSIYFMGESDLYRLEPGGGIKNLSATRIHKFLSDLDRSNDTVILQWDTTRQGCWVFCTRPEPASPTVTTPSPHLWYDARTDSFWQIQIPRGYDPTAAVGYDGDGSGDRAVMMGNRGGYVQKFDDAALADVGTAISSYVYIGPITPAGDIRQAKCNGLDFILGDYPAGYDADDWNLDWTLQVGKDAKSALSSPDETRTGTISTAGEQRPMGLRAGGSTFMLKMANSTHKTFWSMDRVVGRFLVAGRQR